MKADGVSSDLSDHIDQSIYQVLTIVGSCIQEYPSVCLLFAAIAVMHTYTTYVTRLITTGETY